jgi:hypothetical protein
VQQGINNTQPDTAQSQHNKVLNYLPCVVRSLLGAVVSCMVRKAAGYVVMLLLLFRDRALLARLGCSNRGIHSG